MLWGFVNAAGFSSESKKYNFHDASPTPGKNAYRLLLFTNNLKNTVSNTVLATVLGMRSSNYIQPNPARGTLDLFTNDSQTKNVVVRIFNNFGREVVQKQEKFSSSLPFKLNLTGLAAGIYFIEIAGGITSTTEKFLIY